MFLGIRARPVSKDDNLTAICERANCLDNVGFLTSHNPIALWDVKDVKVSSVEALYSGVFNILLSWY
jgi:hypothetical protein